MLDFINKNVTQQGSQSGMNLTPLFLGIVEQIFKDPVTGVAPIVVNISEVGEKVDTRTTYKVTTPQLMLDTFINSANETQAKTRLFVEDKGALIGFNFVEIDELTLTGKVVFNDGEFGVVLSKTPNQSYFYHEEKITAIPAVTQGEIDAYKLIFGTSYDKVENVYKLVVGATEFSLTPAEMIIVNEEYNKTATDGNYTALWANSISKYICCAPWFDGYQKFNLHSAFYNCKAAIIIDLNKERLYVSDLTNAFSGCGRLEQVSGILEVDSQTRLDGIFAGCTTLRVFKMHGLASNLDLSDCPMLAYEVFEDMINYSSMQRITITVHQAVKENIDTNPVWADVKNAIARKPNVQVITKQ